MITRRLAVAGAMSLATAAFGQQKKAPPKPVPDKPAQESDHGWYRLRGDDGNPFPNLRIPNELASQVERLPGLIRAGSDTPDVTVYAFTDYNCPWCRKAAADLEALVASDADLRLGLVNNPVLSAASKDAAKVELAVIKNYGRKDAYRLHMAALKLTGQVNAERALDAAAALGLDRAVLAEAAKTDAELGEALDRQMKLADSMTFSVTPSFLIGSAGVPGYPGPKALAGMVSAMRKCELIACP